MPGGTQTIAGRIIVANVASIDGNIGAAGANQSISEIKFSGDHQLNIDANNAALYVQTVKTDTDGEGTFAFMDRATLHGNIGENGSKAIKAISSSLF
jgi:hypothetical protein